MGGVDDTELLARFRRWDKQLDAHWSTWKREAKECFGFVAGDQWTKDDENVLKDAGRAAVTFNRVGPIIDAVVGAEIMGRQQVQYLPREVGDSGVNEVLTKGAEWVRDQTDAETEESEAFRNAFICGLGWTETRMDYEEDPEGKIVLAEIDSLEVLPDPKARKANLVDARYLRWSRPYALEEFEQRWPDCAPAGSDERTGQSTNDPRHRYEGDDEVADEDTVIVRQYQWYDLEAVHTVEPEPGKLTELTGDEFAELERLAEEAGQKIDSVKRFRRVYWRAFVCGEKILEQEELPDGEFTLKCITGKRDRNKGTWYGLVRPMMDPQRWANKFFSQILHIINSNAKGGLVAETIAFEDQKQAEESWAKTDAITWASPGALSNNMIQPKIAPPIPAMLPALMEMSVAAIRDTTGVNQELLGMVERQQAGVLEHQRKQSAYGILAAFFESFRRYRKLQGRLLLKYMQKYLPDDTLVRIVGDDGVGRYVPLAKQPDTMKFDVIVDEAPAGPNQKERVFALLTQFMPMLKDAGPEVWAELIRYSPLPEALSQKIAQIITQAEAADPQAQAMQQRGAEAEVAEKEGDAAESQAKAIKTMAEAQAMAQPIPMMG